MSVFMIDVDYFKKYNDTYGHEQGDVCLRSVARALAGSISRANDFVARYGGEEFVIVLSDTDEAGARAVAQKALENVQRLNMPHANSTVAPFVTVSIGITTGVVAYGQSQEEYLKRADEALYMSKQGGRNQYTFLER
jgi:diguanylate cyclase (GGDEF)-like protein